MDSKTMTAALTGGYAALITTNAAAGSPAWTLVVLAVLWLPVAVWTGVVWTEDRHA